MHALLILFVWHITATCAEEDEDEDEEDEEELVATVSTNATPAFERVLRPI